MSLETFFNPKSVAIVGASRQKGKVGYEILTNMVAFLPLFVRSDFSFRPRYWDYQLKWVPELAGPGELVIQGLVFLQSGSIEVDGLRFEVELFFVPILRADYRPGMGLVAGSLVLFVLALGALWIASPRLAWLLAEPGQEDTTTLLVRLMPGAESARHLQHLTRRLEEALSDDG
jgi:hypothetical protein